MNKDYQGPRKFKKNEIERVYINYQLNDSCVDFMYQYKMSCLELPRLMMMFPFTECRKNWKLWENCQQVREREIFDKYDKIEKDIRRKRIIEN